MSSQQSYRKLLQTLCVLFAVDAAVACNVRAFDLDDREPQDAYPRELHDKAYDILVGSVTDVDRGNEDRFVRYHVKVLMDLKGSIAGGAAITIRGEEIPKVAMSGGAYSVGVSAGQIAVFYVKGTAKAREFDFVPHGFPGHYPFGVQWGSPAIPPKDVPLLAAALHEMDANLNDASGAGMSRERARKLLHDNNVYLWALACWRLVHQAEREDIEKLSSLFSEPRFTAARAFVLANFLDQMTGNSIAFRPDTCRLLLVVLRRYADAELLADAGVPTTAPSR